ncbi:ribosome maturation factor RimM [Candidatus Vallotia tarda]|uniref:Ribosome maturation factor RimM n=1 Tax=Candidatus Vallotiella hemipterorum TaxID=1177213 RepID=A0A916JSQ8_9BURK|nr:ribosome maturation factor RimM [Candidatus Vallotia tarda]CAG7598291.1 Ribosome maturation factor RimM [Candidatus Vallotia tarda]
MFIRHILCAPCWGGAVWSESGVNKVELFPDNAIEVGKIIGAYGVKGWLRIMPHACINLSGSALLNTTSWWFFKDGAYSAAQVISGKKHGTTIIVKLAGYADREPALTLRGATVYIRRSDFPMLEHNEYYWVDLIGLVVITRSNNALGRVVNLLDNGAHTILCVEYDKVSRNGKITKAEQLIPFVDAYVKRVDLSACYIVVDWSVNY